METQVTTSEMNAMYKEIPGVYPVEARMATTTLTMTPCKKKSNPSILVPASDVSASLRISALD